MDVKRYAIILAFFAFSVSSQLKPQSTNVGSIPAEFNVTSMGGAMYMVPIECPPGINGMQPALSVSYNSLSGDGSLGIGWNLNGLSSISRIPKTLYNGNKTEGINFLYDDEYALDGNRLVLSSGSQGVNSSVYKTENETFQKIEACGSIYEDIKNTGPSYFKVTAKDGRVIEYGNTDDSYLIPGKEINKAPYMWLVSKITDQNGNYITYHYDKSSGTVRLDKIIYGNSYTSATTEILFLFTLRYANAKISYVDGRPIINDYVYTSVGIKNNGKIIYSYEFDYDIKAEGSKFFLSDIKKRMPDGSHFPSPTTINWGGYNTNLNNRMVEASTYYDPSREGCRFISCDINGDGKDDLITYYTANGNNGNTYMERLLNTDTYPSGDKSFNMNSLPAYIGSNIGFNEQTKFHNSAMLLADIDGNGINEFITSYFMVVGGNRNFKIEAHTQDPMKMYSASIPLQNSQKAPAFVCGDFNNDGYDDLLLIEDQYVGRGYPGKIIYFKDGEAISYQDSPTFNLPEAAVNIYVSDFNADGLLDLFILTEKSSYFYRNNGGVRDASGETRVSFYRLRNQSPYCFTSKCNTARCGDFNGDGLLDFLVNENIDGNNVWNLALNNGDFGLEVRSISEFTMVKDNSRKDCVVMDFNHDGKSDVIMVDLINENGSMKTRIGWWESLNWGFRISTRFDVNDENYTFDSSNCVGDFDGDGWPDLFSYRSTLFTTGINDRSYLTYCANTNFASEKVFWITDGMEKDTRIEYRPLSYPIHDDRSVFYSKKARTAYSYCNIQPPLICVSNYNVSAYDDVVSDVSYSYADLAYGIRKKGLYGFTSVKMVDNLAKIKKEASVTWDYEYGLPLKQVENVQTTDGVLICGSESVNGITNDGHFVILPSSVTSTDYLKGITQSVNYSYDVYGNPVSQTSKCSSMEEQRSMEYTDAGSWCKNKLSKFTVRRNNGSGTYTRETEYEYDSKGNLLKEIQDPQDAKKLTTEYSDFTTFGLPRRVSVTGNGITRVSFSVYTPSGRFTSSVTNELRESIFYRWDETLMLLNSETSLQGTTNYTYGNWQRLTKTVTPDGVKTVHGTYRASSGAPTNAFYYTTEHTDGQSPLTVWYDCLGRDIRSEVYGLNGKKICTDTEYDHLGRLYRISKPHFDSESPAWAETCTYDRYGRPATAVTPLGTTSYGYSGLTTDVSTPRGSMQTVLDSSGQTIRQTTNGKSVDYTYYASGLTKTATPQGGNPISMEYDLQGNRTKLIDPDGGTITSKYDAFGQLSEESQRVHKMELTPWPVESFEIAQADFVSPAGTGIGSPSPYGTVTTSYIYLSSGLLYKIKRGSESTEYTYDIRNRVNRISKYGASNSFLTSCLLEYDNFDRVTKTTETVGTEKTMVTKSTYDFYGRPSSVIYPNGIDIYNSYDPDGNLTAVSQQSMGTSSAIWQAVEENALGQLAKERKGAYEVKYVYNGKDLLSIINLPGIVNMSFVYNNKGNLSSRRDFISEQEESFTYDEHNRLTYWQQYRRGQTVGGKAMSYDVLTGNIATKSDVGMGYRFAYGENSAGPHALTSIAGKSALLTDALQKVYYTDFKKVKKITEGSKVLEITYGVDEQRQKETQKIPGGTTK